MYDCVIQRTCQSTDCRRLNDTGKARAEASLDIDGRTAPRHDDPRHRKSIGTGGCQVCALRNSAAVPRALHYPRATRIGPSHRGQCRALTRIYGRYRRPLAVMFDVASSGWRLRRRHSRSAPMTSPAGVIPELDAKLRWRPGQAAGVVVSPRPTASRRRNVPLLIVATVALWFVAHLK